MLNACLLFMDIMVGAERGRPGQGRAGQGAPGTRLGGAVLSGSAARHQWHYSPAPPPAAHREGPGMSLPPPAPGQ